MFGKNLRQIFTRKSAPVFMMPFSDQRCKRMLKRFLSFIGGFGLGQAYYVYLLKKISFPYHTGAILSLIISVLLGIGNVIAIQLRCISLLTVPMYCGKAGRGVLKAVVLAYVVAGPITNMGLNAKEVVRVFACSTQLSYNIAKDQYAHLAGPLRKTARGLKTDIDQVKYTLRSFHGVLAPIEHEMEYKEDQPLNRQDNNDIDDIMFIAERRSDREEIFVGILENSYDTRFDEKYGPKDIYQRNYLKKIKYLCGNQATQAVTFCTTAFSNSYNNCYESMPKLTAWTLCRHLEVPYICNITTLIQDNSTCDSRKQIDPGLGEGYASLKKVKLEFIKNLNDIKLLYPQPYVRELYDIQDGKETGARVTHAFEEKIAIMQSAITIMDICMALLFLRIFVAAVAYHDTYLSIIGFDNVYVTGYFKMLDVRRKMKNKCTLLPLKKMERSKYTDVHSLTYISERGKLFTQILKVLLEMVTATTFVMLDRLFFEALDVVRQYAEAEVAQQGVRDLEVEVEGTGVLASILRKLLSNLRNTESRAHRDITHKQCVPRPRLMPSIFFIKIYGGYLWIILLLYISPYTSRLRRLICSYFYPRREKQRILHLYNDILKKRIKKQKTLRRKAVQAVRAHYLSGENLLSLRMKFPRMLGWLGMFPAARMTCLICGETKPRTAKQERKWNSCCLSKCPFVYCTECWCEIGEKCLACDPSLAELSDIDSLSEDENVSY